MDCLDLTHCAVDRFTQLLKDDSAFPVVDAIYSSVNDGKGNLLFRELQECERPESENRFDDLGGRLSPMTPNSMGKRV